MKIACSISGDTPESTIDSRFGRAPRFLIVDTDSGEYRLIENTQNLNAAQGAGLQSAQNVINAGAEAVITGHTGPKAFDLLSSMNVKIYYAESVTAKESIQMYKNGTLKAAQSADVESHW